MTSQAISSFRFVGKVIVFSALALPAAQASAQAQTTGDSWTVGAAAANDTSVGLAATVNVPVPTDGAVKHSTEPASQPAPDAQPAQPAPGNYGPAQPAAGNYDPAQSAEYEDTDPSALQVFRSYLDPYGRWLDDARYGRVWVPDQSVVGSDFAPYVSNGHWAMDADDNWVWMSDYPFGWVVFHYGRWVWIDSVGWSWVPGRRYAPAWVVWRVPTDDYAYVGWAPAPPYYAWFGWGVYWYSYYPPLPFVFCPSYYVFYPHFGAYLVRDRYFAATLVHHSVWYSTAPVYGRASASPTIARARVPAQAVPSQRVSADPRATSMARPAGNPGIASRGSARNGAGNFGPGGAARTGGVGLGQRPAGMTPGASRPSTSIGSGRPTTSPLFRSNSTAGRYPGFASGGPRSLVERTSPYSSGRQVRSLGSQPSSSYASPRSPSGSFASPRYSSPSGSYSAPRYSSPSTYSAPRYSAPSSSYSTPRFSAPSGSYSAPSHSFSSGHSFSGGGSSFHGGGGGFRGGGGRHR
jgi:hypothetical protein